MIYDRIKMLCKKHGETITGLEKKLGFARGSLSKIDKNSPSSERVKALADFFGVSAEFILTGEEKKSVKSEGMLLSMLEKKIIEKCRLNEKDLEYVCKMLGLEEEYRLDKLYRGESAM